MFQVLITNKRIFFVRSREVDTDNIILNVDYSNLVAVSVIGADRNSPPLARDFDYGTDVFLELTIKSVSKQAISPELIRIFMNFSFFESAGAMQPHKRRQRLLV